MSQRPTKPAGVSSSSQVNRVAKISAYEKIDHPGTTDASPDTLTQLKRSVDTIDTLETSDNAAWTTKVNAMAAPFKQLFVPKGTFSRLRYRHYYYGLDKAALQRAITALA